MTEYQEDFIYRLTGEFQSKAQQTRINESLDKQGKTVDDVEFEQKLIEALSAPRELPTYVK